MKIAGLLTVLLAVSATLAPAADKDSPAPGDHRSFVGCPVIRDTKTVPCWLEEYKGELYYLGIQQDAAAEFYPPQLGHKALVEGVVTDQPRICGGVVLKPVKVSVIPDLDPSCNTMLPAIDEYTVPFAPRGPGPIIQAIAKFLLLSPRKNRSRPLRSRNSPSITISTPRRQAAQRGLSPKQRITRLVSMRVKWKWWVIAELHTSPMELTSWNIPGSQNIAPK